MSKFLIEDDWYVVVLDNCYALGKYQRTRVSDGKERDEMDLSCYYDNPIDVLKRYAQKRQREAVGKARDGTIKDMVDILVAENKRLCAVLETAFSAITSAEVKP